MEHACATITICFEEPFWIALYERIEAGHCTVCKITFGAEPKDYEVYQFLLDHWRHLPFSPPETPQPQTGTAGDQKAA